MSIYNAVRNLSGQHNTITIQRAYVKLLGGDYNLAVVLGQLVWLSGLTSRSDGYFYKKYDELAEEVCLTVDQVRYAVTKLKRLLPDVLTTKVKKAAGTPTTHYHIDGDLLISKLFTETAGINTEKSLPNGNGEITESSNGNAYSTQSRNGKTPKSKRTPSQMETGNLPDGNGEIPNSLDSGTVTESITDLHTDHDKQIKSYCQADELPDVTSPERAVLEHLNRVTGSSFRDAKNSTGRIKARLAEDYTAEDLLLVVDYLTAKWLNDPKMSDYLRPSTLFGPENCAEYFSMAKKWRDSGRPENVNGKWVRSAAQPAGGHWNSAEAWGETL
ncbi:MAG: conserved phage C-terminal domain-containing protein [Plesiomonas shigelloides]